MMETKVKTRPKKPYESCIKINGVPILPPLITTTRRKELSKYKQQALNVEERLALIRKCQKNISEPWIQTDNLISLSDHNYSVDEGVALEVSEPQSIYVPFDNTKKIKSLNLTTDIIDVTEYSETGMKIIGENYSSSSCLNTSTVDLNLDLTYNTTEIETDIKEDLEQVSIYISNPRLTRSNSYTLETPSPLLLAHLEKQNISNAEGDGVNLKLVNQDALFEANNPLFLTENTNETVGQIMEIPCESVVFEESQTCESAEEIEKVEYGAGDNTLIAKGYEILDYMSPYETEAKINNKIKVNSVIPSIEVITTDIMVQQINVTTSLADKSANASSLNILPSNIEIDDEEITEYRDPDSQLLMILKNIPDDYSQQILELIEKQKAEQKKRVESYEILKKELFSKETPVMNTAAETNMDKEKNEFGSSKNVKSASTNTNENVSSKNFSVTGSQTIPYKMPESSCSDIFENSRSTTIKIVDLESEDGTEFQDAFENAIPLDLTKNTNSNLQISVCKNNPRDLISCNNKLFTKVDSSRQLKQEWAASKIGAAVKGYLVRRLINTAKVQALIQTIKDALVCAIELHNAEIIDVADVELHRRLIQQVSGACFAFHDVFFALPITEQMSIIAVDRERIRQRAKSLRTTQSNIEFRAMHKPTINLSDTRLTKSLTKV